MAVRESEGAEVFWGLPTLALAEEGGRESSEEEEEARESGGGSGGVGNCGSSGADTRVMQPTRKHSPGGQSDASDSRRSSSRDARRAGLPMGEGGKSGRRERRREE